MVGKRSVAIAFGNFLETGIFDVPNEGEILQDTKVIDLAFMKGLDADTKDSIGIDAAREAKHFLSQRPAVGAYRVLIIDDAEMLTTEAQNALLKVTEEPPAGSLIIFIASHADGILPTILSRVQSIYFGSIKEGEIMTWLTQMRRETGVSEASERREYSDVEIASVAKRAFGKSGLAWRLLFDEVLKERLELAKQYLKTTPGVRRDFIKELIEPDDFSLRQFLAAVILQLAWQPDLFKVAPVWHKTLELYDGVMNFGLNPRLQLESLLLQ